MTDTSPEAEAKQLEIFARKSPGERLAMGCSMFSFSKILMSSGILRRRPNISEPELRAKLFRRMYLDDFAPEKLERIAQAIRQYCIDTRNNLRLNAIKETNHGQPPAPIA